MPSGSTVRQQPDPDDETNDELEPRHPDRVRVCPRSDPCLTKPRLRDLRQVKPAAAPIPTDQRRSRVASPVAHRGPRVPNGYISTASSGSAAGIVGCPNGGGFSTNSRTATPRAAAKSACFRSCTTQPAPSSILSIRTRARLRGQVRQQVVAQVCQQPSVSGGEEVTEDSQRSYEIGRLASVVIANLKPSIGIESAKIMVLGDRAARSGTAKRAERGAERFAAQDGTSIGAVDLSRMRPGAKYAEELKRAHRYLATWLPATLVQVGTVGIVSDHLLQPVTNLTSQGVTFEIEEGGKLDDFAYQSASGVQIEMKVAGSAAEGFDFLGSADAGVAVRFGKQEGVLFHASGLRERRIADLAALEHDVRVLHGAELWDPAWVVVHEVLRVESLTVIVSSGSGASAELRAASDVSPAVNLARLDLGLSLAGTKNLMTWLVGSAGLTPLFRGKVLKRRCWRARSPKWESALEPDEYDVQDETDTDDENVLVDFES